MVHRDAPQRSSARPVSMSATRAPHWLPEALHVSRKLSVAMQPAKPEPTTMRSYSGGDIVVVCVFGVWGPGVVVVRCSPSQLAVVFFGVWLEQCDVTVGREILDRMAMFKSFSSWDCSVFSMVR